MRQTTWCPGCQAWQLDYDLTDLALERMTVALLNEHGMNAAGEAIAAAASEVDAILLEHVRGCPPAVVWLREEVMRAQTADRNDEHTTT